MIKSSIMFIRMMRPKLFRGFKIRCKVESSLWNEYRAIKQIELVSDDRVNLESRLILSLA